MKPDDPRAEVCKLACYAGLVALGAALSMAQVIGLGMSPDLEAAYLGFYVAIFWSMAGVAGIGGLYALSS
jgi:hypothetical protein